MRSGDSQQAQKVPRLESFREGISAPQIEATKPYGRVRINAGTVGPPFQKQTVVKYIENQKGR